MRSPDEKVEPLLLLSCAQGKSPGPVTLQVLTGQGCSGPESLHLPGSQERLIVLAGKLHLQEQGWWGHRCPERMTTHTSLGLRCDLVLGLSAPPREPQVSSKIGVISVCDTETSWESMLLHVLRCCGVLFPPSRKVTERTLGVRMGRAL